MPTTVRSRYVASIKCQIDNSTITIASLLPRCLFDAMLRSVSILHLCFIPFKSESMPLFRAFLKQDA